MAAPNRFLIMDPLYISDSEEKLKFLGRFLTIHQTYEMIDKLRNVSPLRIKFGIDPTAPDIHLGHTVILRQLRVLQKLGHNIIIIIGDFTAKIGDPTGKNKARPPLTTEQVNDNITTYTKQLGKILNLKQVDIRFNSGWFNVMSASDIIALMHRVTTQQLLARDDFAKRIKENLPIHFHEMLYPCLQAYDSVKVKADVEIGGRDQIYNLLLGRDFQKDEGQPPQVCVTMPLLRGLDGDKRMGKSLNNYIGIMETPYDMFTKIMSIPDALMQEWYDLLTEKQPEGTAIESKKRLAQEIVSMYHSVDEAFVAKDEWIRTVSLGQDPRNIQSIRLHLDEKEVNIVRLLRMVGLVDTLAEAKRLIEAENSNITVGTERRRITNYKDVVKVEDGLIIRVGRKRIKKVELI